MFNFFRLQSECCPNYIILNPSLSCLNRSGFNIYLALQPQGFFRNDSLSLFSNGVFSTFFTFVVFFSWICSTSQGSLVSLVCQRSNLVLPLLFLFRFPSDAILDLGTRSSRSGGVLWRPETDVSGVLRLFAVVGLSFACVLHLIMSSCALHHHVFKTCIRPGSPSSVRCPFWVQPHLHAPATCPKYYFISGRKMFSEWDESWRAVLFYCQ